VTVDELVTIDEVIGCQDGTQGMVGRWSDMYREDVEEEGVRGNGQRSPYSTLPFLQGLVMILLAFVCVSLRLGDGLKLFIAQCMSNIIM
jgi:hypothetical protein